MRVLLTLMFAIASVMAVEIGSDARNGQVDGSVKGLAFFTRFGSSLARNKVHAGLCDYDHPEKSNYCPPAGEAQPFPDYKEPGEL